MAKVKKPLPELAKNKNLDCSKIKETEKGYTHKVTFKKSKPKKKE